MNNKSSDNVEWILMISDVWRILINQQVISIYTIVKMREIRRYRWCVIVGSCERKYITRKQCTFIKYQTTLFTSRA